MQSDHFINRCDELGLLVFEEIPGWQYIGNDHFKELSYQNLQDMILAHFNHPSIVLWGVRINESPDDDDFYAKTNDIARTLDTSRQTAGVRNMKHSHFFEDVYTYNDFVHTGKNEGLTNPRKVTKGLVPYMVTEYNGHIFPTKKFDNEQRRLDHAMRHLAVQEANFKYESCSGAIGWCMNDYNTHSEFGSGDRICYHGVMDMFRIPKYAAAVYASQQRKHPVLTVASNMTMGEYNESSLPQTIIFTNCDYVKVYKNNHYIGTFYSSWDTYPSIPYPPVIVDDYIGDLLKENEKYSPKVANSIKKVLLSFQKNGMNLPLSDKLRVLKLIIVNKLDMIEGEHLFGKYIGNWGQDGGSYRYEGYMDDVPLISVSKGAATQAILVAEPDDLSLHPQDTYDATRIVVRLQDEFGNDRPFASNILSITSSSELAIIGPCQLSLIGGSVGIYVKTTGLLGKGTVRISSPGFSDIVVNIEVK
jgi:beta-galactosidase